MASSASGKQREEVEEIEDSFKGVHTLEVQVSKSVDSQTSDIFQISNKFFHLVVNNNRVGVSSSSHLSIFLEKVDEDNPNVSVFVSFSVSIGKRKVPVKKSVMKKKSRKGGSNKFTHGDSSNVCKRLQGRFSNFSKAFGWGDFIDKSRVYDPSSGILVDNKLVLTVNVTMLNEDLLRGENAIRDIGFPIEEIKKGVDWMGGCEVLLWTMENFSDFVDVLKKYEMTSPCFFLDGRKFWIAICIRHGDVGLELKFDDPDGHIMAERLILEFGLGVVHIGNDDLSIAGKKKLWNAMEGPLWVMKASMLEVDEGYVIDGAAMILCCIRVKHSAEVLESQDGCELPPPDLVTLVPEESKENPADSVAEDADADDDNDVDDTNDADEAAHAGSKIEDLRNKLEEASNRIVVLGIEINTLKDLRSRENKQFGIEINTLKDLRSRENKQFGIEIKTLKDLRSRENKQFKDARFQTNVNHKSALEQMAAKMEAVNVEMRKSYENAREQDKRACQENEKLLEENKKLWEENKKLHQG
ncbi:uncharacterized protein LOC131317701 isoform X2 [Rhododendron vialii]|uniref:uncharacterized protein LOC131317701 isoform X2 n=1 Tax=Rhododendron vialii TaxID=182163 RepID=UPI00265F74C2|nr:uncharacterized protein LOC131317701 isoform X2 [Rhododendron vialii]